ncbi:MAG TPA: hypothetical protein VKT73_10990 [Xanthobacteraceae bacterium]|nr:hypothetical protein [Xanthobacteraceae bacterium]
MSMRNPKVLFLVLGIVLGGLIGYLTRPESAEIRIGRLNIEVTGKGLGRPDDALTPTQTRHIALLALVGGILGLGFGFAVDSGKIKL